MVRPPGLEDRTIGRSPTSGSGSRRRTAAARTPQPQALSPITGHPSEFVDRAADTASVAEHRERPLRVFAIDPSRGVGPRNVVSHPHPVRAARARARSAARSRSSTRTSERTSSSATGRGADGLLRESISTIRTSCWPAASSRPRWTSSRTSRWSTRSRCGRSERSSGRSAGRSVWPWAVGGRRPDRGSSADLPPRGRDAERLLPRARAAARCCSATSGAATPRRATGRRARSSTRHSRTTSSRTRSSIPIVEAVMPRTAPLQRATSAAFQEGFADLVAMLQHFDFHDLVVDTVIRTGGRIHDRRARGRPRGGHGEHGRSRPSSRRATRSSRSAASSARRPGWAVPSASASWASRIPTALATDRRSRTRAAQILLAAVFDAFVTIYARRTADLRRIGGVTASQPGRSRPTSRCGWPPRRPRPPALP